jgi:hypothetical protein
MVLPAWLRLEWPAEQVSLLKPLLLAGELQRAV